MQNQGKYFHETGEREYTIKGNENPQSDFTPICNCSEPGKIGGCAIPKKCAAFWRLALDSCTNLILYRPPVLFDKRNELIFPSAFYRD